MSVDATGKAWQHLAQIQRGERSAGVDGLRLLAETTDGRAVILANPAVMEPLVNILRLAGALPGEDGVAVSTAAAAFYTLSSAPGAPEQLSALAVDMLVPSLLRLAVTGSEAGKQQALAALAWLARLGTTVSRAIVQMGGVSSLPALLTHSNAKVRTGVALLIETLEDSGITDGLPTAVPEGAEPAPAAPVRAPALRPTPDTSSAVAAAFSTAGGNDGAAAAVALTPAAVRSILSCLRDPNAHTQQAAAGMLALCASLSDANKAVMLLERCVEPLLELLRAPADESRVKAAAALLSLTRLSRDDSSSAPAPAPPSAEGDGGDDEAAAAAAAAVAEEAEMALAASTFAVENFHRAVAAVEDLIRWLVHVRTTDRPMSALLEQLIYDSFHIHLSTASGKALLGRLSPVAGDALLVLRKRRPRLDPLLELLLSGDLSALEQARGGMAALASETHAELIAAGALKPLLHFAGPTLGQALFRELDRATRSPGCERCVEMTVALLDVATKNEMVADAMTAAIEPLVRLLEREDSAAREAAGECLQLLCARGGEELRLELARSGALPLLVYVAGCGSIAAREHAVAAVYSLLELMAIVKVEVATSAEAVVNLAGCVRDARNAASAAAAAGSLCLLATTAANKAAMAQAGCVPTMTQALRHPSSLVRSNIAIALLRLADPTATSTALAPAGAASADEAAPRPGWLRGLFAPSAAQEASTGSSVAEAEALVARAIGDDAEAEEAVRELEQLLEGLYFGDDAEAADALEEAAAGSEAGGAQGAAAPRRGLLGWLLGGGAAEAEQRAEAEQAPPPQKPKRPTPELEIAQLLPQLYASADGPGSALARSRAAERIVSMLGGGEPQRLAAARAVRQAATDPAAAVALVAAGCATPLVAIYTFGPPAAMAEASEAFCALAAARVPQPPPPPPPPSLWASLFAAPEQTQEEKEYLALAATSQEVRALAEVAQVQAKEAIAGKGGDKEGRALLATAIETLPKLVVFMYDATRAGHEAAQEGGMIKKNLP